MQDWIGTKIGASDNFRRNLEEAISDTIDSAISIDDYYVYILYSKVIGHYAIVSSSQPKGNIIDKYDIYDFIVEDNEIDYDKINEVVDSFFDARQLSSTDDTRTLCVSMCPCGYNKWSYTVSDAKTNEKLCEHTIKQSEDIKADEDKIIAKARKEFPNDKVVWYGEVEHDLNGTKKADLAQTDEAPQPKTTKKTLIEQLLEGKTNFTEAEKEELRKYQGNGGNGKNTSDRGILDEFYTPDYVCEFMYHLAVKYGYKSGKILEPSCAIGNIIRPFYERNDYTHIDAFEINEVSSKICKILYPNVNLCQNYFETAFLTQPRFADREKETTWLANYPYDLVIGNPPYGQHINRYSSYFRGNEKIKQTEMFFMYMGLKLVKKGGLLIYITSSNFMSTGSLYQDVKEQIGEIAEFVDAYRLPKVFANTAICTDIIVLRKK